MTLAPVLTAALLLYLVWPTHWTEREDGDAVARRRSTPRCWSPSA